jgi:hypothetical protein
MSERAQLIFFDSGSVKKRTSGLKPLAIPQLSGAAEAVPLTRLKLIHFFFLRKELQDFFSKRSDKILASAGSLKGSNDTKDVGCFDCVCCIFLSGQWAKSKG